MAAVGNFRWFRGPKATGFQPRWLDNTIRIISALLGIHISFPLCTNLCHSTSISMGSNCQTNKTKQTDIDMKLPVNIKFKVIDVKQNLVPQGIAKSLCRVRWSEAANDYLKRFPVRRRTKSRMFWLGRCNVCHLVQQLSYQGIHIFGSKVTYLPMRWPLNLVYSGMWLFIAIAQAKIDVKMGILVNKISTK